MLRTKLSSSPISDTYRIGAVRDRSTVTEYGLRKYDETPAPSRYASAPATPATVVTCRLIVSIARTVSPASSQT